MVNLFLNVHQSDSIKTLTSFFKIYDARILCSLIVQENVFLGLKLGILFNRESKKQTIEQEKKIKKFIG